MPLILKTFTDEIKKYGVENVSKQTGIHRNTLLNWISGKTVPSLTVAAEVADIMGLEFLLFDKLPED